MLSSAFTQVQEIPISSGDHYIGIRFYPGRIRTYVSLDLQSQDDAFTLLSNNGYHTIEEFLSSIPRYHNPLEQFEDSLPALLNSSFSKRHKRRLFKQITGFTIQGFRSITKFQQSLHFPDAHQYYDQSHMTHAYNKMTGMTPRTIRDLI